MNAHRTVVVAGASLLGCLALQASASAQTYQFANGQIPSGSPNNNSFTENVDFADVDLDGDMDAVNADGGDCCNDQNRLWINLGFAQAGTIGFFQDQTSTRFPAVTDDSRDMDFVDFDNDNDEDIYTSNTSQIANQSNRFWVNMGGSQGGTLGFFQDQTSTRWLGLGVNNGGTECSSIAPANVLGSGGFIDWSCDCVFGDLDNDGDVDLVHTTYGGAFIGDTPHRLFMNDGTGKFKEYNPSCFQLSGTAIANGSPALWAQGTQQDNTTNTTGTQADVDNTPLGVEIGDLDADYDIDFLIGSRNNPPTRLFRNMRVELNTLIWRDVTNSQLASALPTGTDNYEQEFGDFNNDGDYDIYGLNWPGLNDAVYQNNGTGTFGTATTLSSSGADDNEGDFLDYNNDGNLDIFVGNFSGQDKLYQGNGAGAFTYVTGSQLPGDSSRTLGEDSCDIDLDGDYDILVGNDAGQANALLKNVGQIADNRAASLPHLEQAPNRFASAVPTVVRVHVYDNSSWDVLRYNNTVLQYQVNGGSFTNVTMIYAGGQLFRGEIPGTLVGTIGYRVQSTDEHANTGTSALKTYDAQSGGGCTGSISTYCTAQVSSSGCVPSMSASGVPSLFAPGLFTVTGSNLEASQNGIMFFGTTGQSSTPFGGGTLCVNAPLYRLNIKNSGAGAACTGTMSYTLLEMLAQPQGGPLLVLNQVVNIQNWFRDPAHPSTTGLSNGLQFTICP
jgi:hypothetical protein